jgi:pectin methylesterase-like acyl-CoA thioesterase
MSRFLKPEVVRLNLSHGDWITVKRELTAGEQRRVFARTAKPVNAGEKVEIDLEKAGLCKMVAYLIDWSFTDDAGKPVAIRDMPAEYVMDMLNNLDGESFTEITAAIDAHEKAVEEEKKTRATASGSPVISVSAE